MSETLDGFKFRSRRQKKGMPLKGKLRKQRTQMHSRFACGMATTCGTVADVLFSVHYYDASGREVENTFYAEKLFYLTNMAGHLLSALLS
jgi:hypothetical protein